MVRHTADDHALHIQSLWTVGAGGCDLSSHVQSVLTEGWKKAETRWGQMWYSYWMDLNTHENLTIEKASNYSQFLL